MIATRRLACWLTLLLIAAACSVAEAGDWRRWRGPHDDGTLAAGEAGDVFPPGDFGLERVWRRSLGPGYSGVAVAGGLAVTLFADPADGQDYVVALEAASGEERWRHRIDAGFRGRDGAEDGPLAWPTIDGDVVYALGPKGRLLALDLAGGRRLWSVELAQAFGGKQPHFGFTAAPLVAGEVLVVAAGGEGHAWIGLDKASGELRWATGDDWIEYHAPVLATLGGRRQVVGLSNTRLVGIEPADGTLLWSQRYGRRDRHSTAQVVPLPDDRLLVTAWPEVVVFRYRGAGEEPLEELWRNESLNGRLAVPVYHRGYLYGFAGSFLTCVDAATGEKAWKSRPPGGSGLIRVGDRLVIFGRGGEVVVVEATPEGYRERARLAVAEREGVTYPSFAGGMIFVRNTRDVAALRIGRAVAAEKPARPANAFEAFVREVEGARNRRALVDSFLRRQERFPIVEGELVHFVFHGRVEDVAIGGSMVPGYDEEELERIADTDLYYKTYRLEPGSRVEYYFAVDFEHRIPDPLNPRRLPYERGWWDFEVSEVALPGYARPPWVDAYRGARAGRLESFEHASDELGAAAEVTVYLPPGYDESDADYPLLVVVDPIWQQRGDLASVVDHRLEQGAAAPLVVAFVPPRSGWGGEQGGPSREGFARLLARELVGALEGRYRLRREASSRALLGHVANVADVLFAARSHPEVFAGAALLSIEWSPDRRDELFARLEGAPPARQTFFVGWNLYDREHRAGGVDLRSAGAALFDRLRRDGHRVLGGEARDASGWGSWRARAGEILAAFFPP